jgi:tetratricopeptide (TPR) repeat protein
VALMAIKGSLKEASLPDVIQLLFLGRRTGCLALADRHNFGTIYFEEGHIVYAAIVNRRDRLGDILLRNGRLTQAQLQQAIDRQEGDREHKLGEILQELGFVSRADLESHIRLQIEEAVYYLFTWTSGTFNFEAGVRPEREDFLVRINPEFLLLEGARRVDEWSLIEKKIPSFDLIFSVDPAHIGESSPELSPEQHRLVPLLDGSRDVQAVIDASGLVEFEVGKALYGLITAGFAHRTGTSTAAGAKPAALHNLGYALERLGRLDEAEAAYGDAAGRARDDARIMLSWGVAALKRGEHQVAQGRLARTTELLGGKPAPALWFWAATLASAGLDDAPGALKAARAGVETYPANPVLQNNLAVLLELAGDAQGAESALRTALGEDPSVPQISKNLADILYRGGRYEEAREAYERAAKLAPDLGDDLYFKLGNIAYKRRDKARARESWSRATELNPGHELARANLEMLDMTP